MVLNILMGFFCKENNSLMFIFIIILCWSIITRMPVSFRRFPIITVNTLYHLIHFVQSGMLWLTGVVLSVQIVCVGKKGEG